MRRAVLIAAAVASAIVGIARPAGAAQITDIGWWTRNPGASAPEGGFQVALGANETISVAAVRFFVPAGEITSAILTLTEAGGFRQDGATLRICPTRAAWRKTAKGDYGAAPPADCSLGEAMLVRNAQGPSWQAEVSELLGSRAASLMVLPVKNPDVPVDPGFEVQVSAATIDIFGSEPSGPAPAGPAPGAPVPGSLGAPGTPPADTPSVPTVPAPDGPSTPEGGTSPVTQPTAPSSFDPPLAAAGDDDEPVRRAWGRLLVFVPLAGALGGGAALARRALAARGFLAG